MDILVELKRAVEDYQSHNELKQAMSDLFSEYEKQQQLRASVEGLVATSVQYLVKKVEDLEKEVRDLTTKNDSLIAEIKRLQAKAAKMKEDLDELENIDYHHS